MNFNGTLKSISNSAKKVNSLQNTLDGLRSESGWERIKSAAKIFLGGK